MSLTQAQKLLLNQVRAGETLVRQFDVWAGYRLELRPSGKRPHAQTVQALISAGLLGAGEVERLASGTNLTKFHLTAAATGEPEK